MRNHLLIRFLKVIVIFTLIYTGAILNFTNLKVIAQPLLVIGFVMLGENIKK